MNPLKPALVIAVGGLFLIALFILVRDDDSPASHPDSRNTADKTKMVFIPAGNFEMGIEGANEDESPVHTVYLDAFYIDIYEVTIAEYKVCVAAGFCEVANKNYWDYLHRLNFDEHCNYDLEIIDNRRSHPVNCVTWENAVNYCRFVSKRLPTEAEWEKAATWKNNRKHAFSSGKSSVSCADAVMMKEDDGLGCGKKRTWQVGSKPVEINGTHDMAGNVWEWVADNYGRYTAEVQRNPKGPKFGDPVIRGGGWDSVAFQLRGVTRHHFKKDTQSYELGFRCAVSD